MDSSHGNPPHLIAPRPRYARGCPSSTTPLSRNTAEQEAGIEIASILAGKTPVPPAVKPLGPVISASPGLVGRTTRAANPVRLDSRFSKPPNETRSGSHAIGISQLGFLAWPESSHSRQKRGGLIDRGCLGTSPR
eukprot:TRINITY_DN4206_c0_g1_i5.p1 TRINITY_DN4206_c0_g1~~TRINITY_DN4206_c0_g1_i5.p1  ORF type:complete len:135 (+),score=6.61 TRINITY_DN4206_c0_g1_i5:223-627(+)